MDNSIAHIEKIIENVARKTIKTIIDAEKPQLTESNDKKKRIAHNINEMVNSLNTILERRQLNEELSFDDYDRYGDDEIEIVDGEYSPEGSECEGDAQIDVALSELGADENQYIDNIRKSALSAMAELADDSTGEQFQLLNKIFNMCQSLQNKAIKTEVE